MSIFRKKLSCAVIGMVLILFGRTSDGSVSFAENQEREVISSQWVTEAASGHRLEQRVFESKAAGTSVSYHVYTPEAYDTEKNRTFPVIYWLHGYRGGPKSIPKILEYYSEAISEGHIPPAIIVFPNGMEESMWVNSIDGKVPMETLIVKELIPEVDVNFRTVKSRGGRLVEGFSMGGYGAARLGMKYPDIFGAISLLGAGPLQTNFLAGPEKMVTARIKILNDVYGNNTDTFREMSPWVLAEKKSEVVAHNRIAIRIVVGDRDGSIGANQDFSDHLKRLNIPHMFEIVRNVGHHPMKLLKTMGETNWLFYQNAFLK